MRDPRGFWAVEDTPRVALPALLQGRLRLDTCVVQARLTFTCTGIEIRSRPRTPTLLGCKRGQDAAEGSCLSLDKRGPHKGSAMPGASTRPIDVDCFLGMDSPHRQP